MSGTQGAVDRPPTALYGYIPSRAVAVIFLLLFFVSTGLHVGQAIKYPMRWFLYTAGLCGVLEALGWGARLWSSFSPLAGIAFQIQITATIVAPTPLLAASFIIFGKIIKMLGLEYSRFSPKWYTILFSTCDVLALFIQGAGGGIAATANELKGANKGGNIMLIGIVFQLIVILTYACCAVEFLWRYNKRETISRAVNVSNGRGEMTEGMKHMLRALAFSFVLFFIRSIYRIVELSDGWGGRIIRTQIYFILFDGVMIVLAMYTLNIAHPGRLEISSDTSEIRNDTEKAIPKSKSVEFPPWDASPSLRRDYVDLRP